MALVLFVPRKEPVEVSIDDPRIPGHVRAALRVPCPVCEAEPVQWCRIELEKASDVRRILPRTVEEGVGRTHGKRVPEGTPWESKKPDLLDLIGEALDAMEEFEDDQRRALSNDAIRLLQEEASAAAVRRAAKRFRERHGL